jgi:hypothetical protein
LGLASNLQSSHLSPLSSGTAGVYTTAGCTERVCPSFTFSLCVSFPKESCALAMKWYKVFLSQVKTENSSPEQPYNTWLRDSYTRSKRVLDIIMKTGKSTRLTGRENTQKRKKRRQTNINTENYQTNRWLI